MTCLPAPRPSPSRQAASATRARGPYPCASVDEISRGGARVSSIGAASGGGAAMRCSAVHFARHAPSGMSANGRGQIQRRLSYITSAVPRPDPVLSRSFLRIRRRPDGTSCRGLSASNKSWSAEAVFFHRAARRQ
jgi:hypothetical protein